MDPPSCEGPQVDSWRILNQCTIHSLNKTEQPLIKFNFRRNKYIIHNILMLAGERNGRRGKEKEGGRRYKYRELAGFGERLFWEVYEKRSKKVL